MLTGAPIRVDSVLLDDPEAQQAAERRHWRQLPASTAEIAAEARDQMRWRSRPHTP